MNVDQSVIDAFKLMWGNFPEYVMLADKDYNIIAVNSDKFEGYKVGMTCAPDGKPHKGCPAAKALKTGRPMFYKYHDPMKNRDIIAYWLPLEGHPELYVHFGVGVNLDYDNL